MERVTQTDVLEAIQRQLQEMSDSNIAAFEQIDQRLTGLENRVPEDHTMATETSVLVDRIGFAVGGLEQRMAMLEAQKTPKFVLVNGGWIQDRRSGSDRRKS